jgi:hypothetical protein
MAGCGTTPETNKVETVVVKETVEVEKVVNLRLENPLKLPPIVRP